MAQIEAVGLSEGWIQGEIDGPEGAWHVVGSPLSRMRYGYQIAAGVNISCAIQTGYTLNPTDSDTGYTLNPTDSDTDDSKPELRPAPNSIGWGDWHEQHQPYTISVSLGHNKGNIIREKSGTECTRTNHEHCVYVIQWDHWVSNCVQYNTTPYEGRRPFWL